MQFSVCALEYKSGLGVSLLVTLLPLHHQNPNSGLGNLINLIFTYVSFRKTEAKNGHNGSNSLNGIVNGEPKIPPLEHMPIGFVNRQKNTFAETSGHFNQQERANEREKRVSAIRMKTNNSSDNNR